MTARNWRYCGSGAEMMSELVVGSAWICPPVDGWFRPEEFRLPALLPRPPPLEPLPVLEPPPKPLLFMPPPLLVCVRPPLDAAPWLPPCAPPAPPAVLPQDAAIAARSVAASFTASAFLRYTTWMLPVAALLPGAAGWSSRATSERTRASRAGLAARTISALLRGSGTSVVLNPVSVWPTPGAAAPAAGVAALPVPSIRRDTSGASSLASACCSGITSTSLALDTSMAATMRPRRARLSA